MVAKKPTLADVSAACDGIHRNTISKILKGTYEGDADTIALVKGQAERLGYSMTPAASNPVEAVSDDELPDGVKLYEPKIKLTRDHKWTLEYSIRCACEWEYDLDEDGQPILESKTAVEFEDRNFTQCLPHRPTIREIELQIAQQKSMLPESV